MSTPQLAERPTKKQPNYNKISHRLTVFWFYFYVTASVLFVLGGDVPNRNIIESTNGWWGYVHGFYSIPSLVATLASENNAIYQPGGGVGYDVTYAIGVVVALMTMKSYANTWLHRRRCL